MSMFKDKVVWITGAGTGVGRAVAHMYAREGATMALFGRRPEPLEGVYDEVCRLGGHGVWQAVDVSDRQALAAAAKEVMEKLQRVDILVNNAGLNIVDRSLEKLTPEGWDQVVQVNLTGAFNVIHTVLPAMRQQKDGLIINISSIAGVKPSALAGGAYTASKFGLTGFNGVINEEEWRNGIRATAVCPGEINTPIMEKRPVKLSQDDLDRMIQPEDLADTVRFLSAMPARTHIPEILVMPVHRRTGGP